MKPAIATVINYCTQDYRFLSLCVKEAEKFSDAIIIPVCSHFFDGAEENAALLKQSYADHPNCHFIEFAYDSRHPYGMYAKIDAEDPNWSHYWHSTARYVGYHYIPKAVSYVLFIDVDEIFDGDRFLRWLQNFPYEQYDVLRFSSYFYFRDPMYRMQDFTQNAVLAKKEKMEAETTLLSIYERKAIFMEVEGRKLQHIVDERGIPFVHHYSWVRTKEELLYKVQRWGHCKEGNFTKLLEKEFSGDFRGFDCVYGKSYEQVLPVHDPLKVKVQIDPSKIESHDFSNVTKVDKSAILRKSVQNML